MTKLVKSVDGWQHQKEKRDSWNRFKLQEERTSTDLPWRFFLLNPKADLGFARLLLL
jgi:hypothetical protein